VAAKMKVSMKINATVEKRNSWDARLGWVAFPAMVDGMQGYG